MTAKHPRSQATRDRIEAAARRVFSAHGYDRATIRMIAAEADIHASMVMRYFGTKEALFATAVQFDLKLPDLAGVPRSQRGPALVAHFLDRWEQGAGELPALLRAAVSSPEARTRLTHIFEGQLVATMARIGDPATAGDRASLVASQMLGLALTRYVLEFETARSLARDTIVERVGAAIQSYLEEPDAGSGADAGPARR